MASITKVEKGWRAFVKRKLDGNEIRKTATFTTRGEAQQWSALIESQIDSGKLGKAMPGKTVGDLFTKFAEEVSPGRKGGDWEIKRLKMLGRDDLAKVPLTEVNPTHIAQWRDRRLALVKQSTVRREWNVIATVFNTAVSEWKWVTSNPTHEAKRPAPLPAREATWSAKQIDLVTTSLGYHEGKATTVGQRVACAFLFALETAMRAGEIRVITREDVEGNVLRVRAEQVGSGKTAAAKRRVPLSKKALAILDQVDYNFDLSAQQLDANFRKYRDSAGVSGVTFHDTRATAITRLAKILDILDLARAIGHRNIQELMTYYREDPSAIASKLG